jgi:hypothetical protein
MNAATAVVRFAGIATRYMVVTVLALFLLLLMILGYLFAFGNIQAKHEGCTASPPGSKLEHVDTQAHWRWLPPRWVCLYWTPSGKVVERQR